MVYDFDSKDAFRLWLKEHHQSHEGIDIYMYKKGHEHEGLTYEDAVRTALCYGWFDAVTHSYNEQKFIQYFARRQERSNWSLSNIKRMKTLIESGDMTEAGLKYFDIEVLEHLDELIEAERLEKERGVVIPDMLTAVLKKTDTVELFEKQTNSAQKRFVMYIMDAKQEKTRINRCHKVVGILQGEKNNL